MHAAVVEDFTRPPQYGEFADPVETEDLEVVQVLAAGVHRIVRSRAAGEHYSAGDELPQIPGVDGVVRTSAGARVFSGGCPAPFGTLAEQTLVPRGFAVPVPDGLDDITAAAIVNPAASSWVPLRRLLPTDRQATVLVLGATGVSGGLAVQVARHLGAQVIAAGRNRVRLDLALAHGAAATIDLTADIARELPAAAPDGVDIVLDYVWGDTAAAALGAVALIDRDPRLPVEHVQLGATAGRTLPLDASLLRARNLRISGSGLGSVDGRTMLQAIAGVLDAAARGILTVEADAHPLSRVADTWDSPARLVYRP